jgi:phosphosulfolactate phosphohydrolase-like enzyme
MKITIIKKISNLKKIEIKDKNFILIDVFRATSTLALLAIRKDRNVYLSDSFKNIEKKWLINRNYSILSDMNIKKKDDNSPSSILSNQNLRKNIVLITHNGTKVANMLYGAKEVICGSFINFYSVINYIKKNQKKNWIILPSGDTLKGINEIEDDVCAEAFKNYLEKSTINFKKCYQKLSKAMKNRIKYRQDFENVEKLTTDLTLCSTIGLIGSVPRLIYKKNKIRCFDVSREF